MGIQIEKQVVGFESKLQGARLGCLFLGLGFHYPYHFLHQLLYQGCGYLLVSRKANCGFRCVVPRALPGFCDPGQWSVIS